MHNNNKVDQPSFQITPYDEDTPQQKFIRRCCIIVTVIYIVTATIYAVVNGFADSDLFAYALLAIGMFASAVTTFALV